MKGQDVKDWGVYKGRELPDKGDLEKISRREHLEQEHWEKSMNSVLYCIAIASSGKLVISFIYT